ncbi:SH3 domain-containing protein [Psychrobacillus sp. FSL H8-0483]|uniref:SH3 domain-containing protein n=1 Tax=Psychrobacillus sp. FSL H8-0483 TaxID=2921389 RepID=UPI00315A4CE4
MKQFIRICCIVFLVTSLLISVLPEIAQAATTQSATVNTSFGYVREKADLTSKKLGTVVKGDILTLYSSSKTWTKIEYNNSVGYVLTKHLILQELNETSITKQATVNIASLNVRAKSSVTSKKLGSLKKGMTVSVYSTSKGWAKIVFNNQTAYVSEKYLTFVKTTTLKPKFGIVQKEVAATKYSSRSSAVIDTLSEKVSVYVYASNNGVSRIDLNGTPAFVPTSSLKLYDFDKVSAKVNRMYKGSSLDLYDLSVFSKPIRQYEKKSVIGRLSPDEQITILLPKDAPRYEVAIVEYKGQIAYTQKVNLSTLANDSTELDEAAYYSTFETTKTGYQYGIRNGDTLESLMEKMGEPKSIDKMEQDNYYLYEVFHYDNLHVGIAKNTNTITFMYEYFENEEGYNSSDIQAAFHMFSVRNHTNPKYGIVMANRFSVHNGGIGVYFINPGPVGVDNSVEYIRNYQEIVNLKLVKGKATGYLVGQPFDDGI